MISKRLAPWIIALILCAIASNVASHLALPVTQANLVLLGLVALVNLIKSVFKADTMANPNDDGDKVITYTIKGLTYVLLSATLFHTLTSVNTQGFSAEIIIWLVITVPVVCFILNDVMRSGLHLLWMMKEKRKQKREQVLQAHAHHVADMLIQSQSAKIDLWEKQLQEGSLPNKFEDLR